MRRTLAICAVLVALTGCAGGAARDGGLATLDALNDAQAACAAKGRTLKLKPEGDAQRIDAYACERN